MSPAASSPSITVAAHVLQRVVAFCERRGHDAHQLCKGAGLPLAVLQRQQERIPLPEVERLCVYALELTGDEHFGLHLAEDVEDGGQYDVGVLVMMASATFGQALNRFAGNLRFWGDGKRVAFRRLEDGMAIRSTLTGPPGAFIRHSQECSLAEIALGARVLSGQPLRARVVRFAHSTPESLKEHQRIFDCPLEFNAEASEIEFDQDALATPMRHGNEAFLAIFSKQLDQALARLPSSQGTSDAVQQVARVALCNGGLSLAHAARRLAMSERTLQRRLQEEQTTFAAVVEAVRQEMATEYLGRGLPVGEVSELLGYADATAFHHAFRRWTGRSPAQYVRAGAN